MADGIGGYEGGEVASALTVATVREVVTAARGTLEERLREAFATANERILRMQRSEGTLLGGMGTTLTALALDPGGPGTAAHIGDSRLYRVRDGCLDLLSRDHNVGSELVERGVVPPQDLAHHPQRHMLTRALGAEKIAVPDVFLVPCVPGDTFLLVTDGLVEALGEGTLLAETGAALVFRDVGPRLIAGCERTVARDDATVVGVRLTGEPGHGLTGEGPRR